jgi:hypothetical protein
MSDGKDIKEIISEVDADNVSKRKFIPCCVLMKHLQIYSADLSQLS